MSDVWVVETGDYEQRQVVLVAATVEAAAAELKTLYAARCVIPPAWDEPVVSSDDSASIDAVYPPRPPIGRRSTVQAMLVDYAPWESSSGYREQFDLTRYEVAA